MEILQAWCRHMLLPPPRRECPFLFLPHFLPHIILSNCFLHSLLSPSCEGQRPVAATALSVSMSLSRSNCILNPLSPAFRLTCWDTRKMSMHLKCCYVSKQFLLGFKILSILFLTSKILSLSLQIWLDSLLSLFPLTVFFFLLIFDFSL